MNGAITAAVLLVDDDEEILKVWQTYLLKSCLARVDASVNGEDGLARLCEGVYDLCLLDLAMPRRNGLEVLAEARRQRVSTRIVLVSGVITVEQCAEAMRLGAEDVWTKGFGLQELYDRVLEELASVQRLPHLSAERVDRWIAGNIKRKNLRISLLQTERSTSESYAAKLLKEYYGMTFPERVAYHRVEKAKGLLGKPAKLIEDVAKECGFSSSRRLDEAFKRWVGTSPSEYQNDC